MFNIEKKHKCETLQNDRTLEVNKRNYNEYFEKSLNGLQGAFYSQLVGISHN